MAILARHTLGDIILLEVDDDPDGVIPAPKGSFAYDSANATSHQNTDGATAWSTLATSAGSGIGAFLTFGVANIGSSTTVRYMDPWYSAGTAVAPTTPIQYRLPGACTFKNMRARHNDPSGNANVVTYTLRLNNVATLLSVGLAADASDASELVVTVAGAAGDLVDIEITKSGAIAGGGLDAILSLECT